MSRRQSQPCYPEPEPGQPEGCFPDNARTPSIFQCWLAGGRIGPAQLPGRAQAPVPPGSGPAPVQARPLNPALTSRRVS
jgi:hypothetical protein